MEEITQQATPVGPHKVSSKNLLVISFLVCVFLVILAGILGYVLGLNNSKSKEISEMKVLPTPSVAIEIPNANTSDGSLSTVTLSGKKISYKLPPNWSQIIDTDKISIYSQKVMFGNKVGESYSSRFLEIKNVQKTISDYRKDMQNNVDIKIADKTIGGNQGFTYLYSSPGEVTSYVLVSGNSSVWDIHVSKPDGIPTDVTKGEQAEKELNDFINSITTD